MKRAPSGLRLYTEKEEEKEEEGKYRGIVHNGRQIGVEPVYQKILFSKRVCSTSRLFLSKGKCISDVLASFMSV